MPVNLGGMVLAGALSVAPGAVMAQSHSGTFTLRHQVFQCIRAPCPGLHIVEVDGRRFGAAPYLVIDTAGGEEATQRLRLGVRAKGGVTVRGRVTIADRKVEVFAQHVGVPGGD